MYSTKSTVDPTVMTIFRETDKVIEERRLSQRNPLMWPGTQRDDETETAIEYSATVTDVIDRLNLMGFTVEASRVQFDLGVKEKLGTFLEWQKDGDGEWLNPNIELLKELTYDSYMEAFAEIFNNKLVRWTSVEELPDNSTPLMKYIFRDDDYEMYFGFPRCDIRFFLRTVMELVPNSGIVTQDITDLVDGGYYNRDDAICEVAVDGLIGDYIVDSKILVLTEGSSDKHILEGALNLLFPHLSGYYSFMDFGISKAAGGAPALVNTIKAFVGAGVGNRVVALFDNDTAAKVAQKALVGIDIPPTIQILNYPEIDIARSYPTLGPTGLSNVDINGLAGSIEIYLGRDVLEEDGQLIPIQWKGYDSSLNQYQGEILNKNSIQRRYSEKLQSCINEPEKLSVSDWTGVRLILESIFECFKY